ncbi:MAG: hypothetical protein JSW66_20220 [Phycisphaerales bacterium]|nr:MAG: hypothetical protein JSW66_20220 [Phycisphaerales bacterium]
MDAAKKGGWRMSSGPHYEAGFAAAVTQAIEEIGGGDPGWEPGGDAKSDAANARRVLHGFAPR